MRLFKVLKVVAVMIVNKFPNPVLFTSSRFSFFFVTLLQIQGINSFGSYYMSVDRYLQLENGTVNSLQVSKNLYENEAIRYFP